MLTSRPPVDLLVVGGLTIDRFGTSRRAGGAARYASLAAAMRGHEVALITSSGEEREVAGLKRRLRSRVRLAARSESGHSITFEHQEADAGRRLRLLHRGPAISLPRTLPVEPRAVLVAPVLGEVDPSTVARLRTETAGAVVGAGLQGWLRSLEERAVVEPVTLASLDAVLRTEVGTLDVLVASAEDLLADASDAEMALAALRAWIGSGPMLVVTAGPDGAWLDEGNGARWRQPAPAVVEAAENVGAGDAFAALLLVSLGGGQRLRTAAELASGVVAELLAARQAAARPAW
ncbi:MAG: PfkB family carbohydrate kinase [Candidatus Limnocylindria bacterium]